MTDVIVRKTVVGDKERVVLTAPYHPDLPSEAKSLGGKWDPSAKSWVFDPRDEQDVRALAREVYGTDDTAGEPMVTVRLDLVGWDRSPETWFAGRRILWRPGRDAEVRLGDGVRCTAGFFCAGGSGGGAGSVKYPAIGDTTGVVLEVRDVPAGHPDLAEPSKGVSILGDADAQRRVALEAERDRLLARLAEIEAQLGATATEEAA